MRPHSKNCAARSSSSSPNRAWISWQRQNSFPSRTRRKLAPSISPGKSWEGVWGGMLGVLALATLWLWLDRAHELGAPSVYTRLYQAGPALLVGGALFLCAMSVVGDLFESLVKRSAGMKDSSQLLPGHGGVLDRIDALLPTLPLAMLAATLVARFA